MNDYGPKNNRGYRFKLVKNDNFSKFVWRLPLKDQYAESITNAFSEIVKTSKRKPNLFETDEGREYVYKRFNEILKQTYIKRQSRNISLGAVFAEKFNRTIRNLSTKIFFEGKC